MDKKTIKVNIDKLEADMILGEDIYDQRGNILLSAGIKIKDSYIDKIMDTGILEVKIIETIGELPFINSMKDEGHKKISLLYEIKTDAKKLIQKNMEKLFYNEKIDIKNIVEIVSKIIDELMENDEIVISLGHLRSVDDYTFEHSVNVCVLSLLIGISIGYEKKDLMDLGMGAILHDIGKMLIPQDIINKPGPLTPKEYEVVKKHTTYGFQIIKNNKNISQLSADIVLYHHERIDGLGYPRGKKGNELNVFAKIVAICDVYDALTSNRVYKKKIEPFNALTYIKRMTNIQFDSEIVNKFINCIGIYPLGSTVKLNTQEVGIVIGTNEVNPREPIVRIIVDKYGKKINNDMEIDIHKSSNIYVDRLVTQLQ